MADPKNEYKVSSEDLEKLINLADDLIRHMLKELEPTTSYCTNLFVNSNPNKVVQSFFKWLAADTTLGTRGAINNIFCNL